MSESEFDDGDKMYWCQIFFWITKTWLYIDDFFPCLQWFDHVVNFWGSAFDYIKDCTIINIQEILWKYTKQINDYSFFLSSVPFSFCSKWWNQNDLSNFHEKKMIECTIFHVVHYEIRLFYWCGKISLIVFFILVVLHIYMHWLLNSTI